MVFAHGFRYIPSCQKLDAEGCIEKLIETSLELSSQCRASNEVIDKFADLMERLLRRKLSGYEECFLSIVQSAPLSISEDTVRTAAAEIGKWGDSGKRKASEDSQLVPNSVKVDQAIKIWLRRVRESVAKGTLHKEANLISILYRFAQLSDDYKNAYGAISRMCETDNGLAAFLGYFEKGSHFLSDKLMLVEDAEKLAHRINKSTLKDEYIWLAELLEKEETVNFCRAQVAKFLPHDGDENSIKDK